MRRDLFETLRNPSGSLNLHHPENAGRNHRRGDRASTSNTEKAVREPWSSARIAGNRNRPSSLARHQPSQPVARAVYCADRFKWRVIFSHLAASDRLRVPEAPVTSTKQNSTPVTGSRNLFPKQLCHPVAPTVDLDQPVIPQHGDAGIPMATARLLVEH